MFLLLQRTWHFLVEVLHQASEVLPDRSKLILLSLIEYTPRSSAHPLQSNYCMYWFSEMIIFRASTLCAGRCWVIWYVPVEMVRWSHPVTSSIIHLAQRWVRRATAIRPILISVLVICVSAQIAQAYVGIIAFTLFSPGLVAIRHGGFLFYWGGAYGWQWVTYIGLIVYGLYKIINCKK